MDISSTNNTSELLSQVQNTQKKANSQTTSNSDFF